ncbi:MAG TPA: hypothetical protein VMM82_15355 [Spirochaetia bacterium]|nr:hypothetical protein [Spirochaetia bacterium]
MPLQNRVTPFGEIIATEHRGTLMGNRGCLHDKRRHIRRSFAVKRWIVCVLEFRGRHRSVMSAGRYTELFFLDEATALAAGHRPCAECQHERYVLFREAWKEANAGILDVASCTAEEMDSILHEERLDAEKKKRTYLSTVSELPAGVLVADDAGTPFLIHKDGLLRWEPGGYSKSHSTLEGPVHVLTPRSIVRAISAGFPVTVHISASDPGGSPHAGMASGRLQE